MKTPVQRAADLIARQPVIRPRDLAAIGVPRTYLSRMVSSGQLERVGRGIYSSTTSEPTEHRSFVEVSKKVPQGVLCLASALRFHGLTTENPFEIWIALKRGAWAPRIESPAIRVIRLSEPSMSFGIETHIVEATAVRVYTPAKTVADCFKFRSSVGLENTISALRECLGERKATIDQIWAAAKICRVANVMQPYLESMT